MRSSIHACVLGLSLALAAGCGDNQRPGLVVETSIPRQTVAAGERIGARCAVLDTTGAPALDAAGDPLTDSTEFVITYQHEDSFAKDAEDQVIAARVGAGTVRCSAPGLELLDARPETVQIVAGPPYRVVTQLAGDTAVAGEPIGVSCLTFDAFNNPVTGFAQELALSPFGAGTEATSETVTATLAGEYEVSCVVGAAAQVEEDFLVVVPALPSAVAAVVSPERVVYASGEQVTLVAEARDRFGNRVDDAVFDYRATAGASSPSEARFQFDRDGTVTLTATVTSPTHDGAELVASRTVAIDSVGPAIECRRADAPAAAAEAYMMQGAPATRIIPVRVTDTFDVQSVTIGGTQASLNPATGNYEAGVPVGFGMTFVDVVARDQSGRENSTTCFVLVAEHFTPEDAHMTGALAMRLDPAAIGDGQPAGLNSINDILGVVLNSAPLRGMVDQGLVELNPISSGDCGIIACTPNVTYNAGTIQWGAPTSTLRLVNGGLQATVTLPSVQLRVRACGTTCCIGGSNIRVTSSSIVATVDFGLRIEGGVLRASLLRAPAVAVNGVALDGSGFCGLIIDLIEGFLRGGVRDSVRDGLASFINSDVAPLLDDLVSSLDINTLAQSFAVPRLDGPGTINLGFGLSFSTFNITPTRALLGIGTRFTPGANAHNRPSLGVPRRIANPLLDPPGTSPTRSVAVALHEGLLNQVLHGLWRGGFFQAQLAVGGGTATIDARLPPVAAIVGDQAQMMLGGIQATIRIPGIINEPIPILFGGRAGATVTFTDDALRFGNLTLTELFVSFRASLTQNQRNAMASFLTQILQSVLADAINDGLPAFPIPTFALPDTVGEFGLPSGAQLGVVNPQLTTSGSHFVLTGSFGVRN